MNAITSVLHATYGRPEKAVRAMLQWHAVAAQPHLIEWIFAVNTDDPTVDDLLHHISLAPFRFSRVHVVDGDFAGSAPAWDAAAKESQGSLLVQCSDDIEAPHFWDCELAARLTPPDRPCFIAVSDGYRQDGLCVTAIMNRAFYEMEGCFLRPEFKSVFSDDDVTLRALKAAHDGRATFIEARQLMFRHRHAYHDKAVPLDATYARQNNPANYAQGQRLFVQRNAEALKLGLKTW